MKGPKTAALLSTAAFLVAALGSGAAEAGPGHRHHHRHHHHGHHHHGARLAIFAAPLVFAPRYVYPAQPIYVTPQPPPSFVEQPRPVPAPTSYWYYCAEYRAYYPHVQSCPGAWQQVLPQPPG